MKHFSLTLASALLLLAGTSASASLPGMKVIKLASRGYANYDNLRFGHAVAMNETYAIVSERGLDPMSPKAGAVHVFNAATGAFIRTLRPTTSKPNDGFGFSLAIHGTKLLVGAFQEMQGEGGAYLFDLTTGRQLASYPGPFSGSSMGYAVGLSDSHVVVSAPEMNNQRGTLHIYPLDGSPSVAFIDATGNSMDKLGQAISIQGSRIAATTISGKIVFLTGTTAAGVVSPSNGNNLTGLGLNLVGRGFDLFFGASDSNNGASFSGAVARLSYLNTATAIIPVDAVPAVNRRLGRLIAVEGTLLAASANVLTGRGIVLHDLNRRQNLITIDPNNLGTPKNFESLAMAGGRLLVGVPFEDHLATESGAAYLIQNVPQPAPFEVLASRGDQAPGAQDISWNTFGDAAMMPSGLAVARATLSGKGSNGSKDSGLYSELGHKGYFDSVAKSRQTFVSPVVFNSIGSPVSNDPSSSLFSASLSGPTTSSANNTALLADSTGGVTTVARKGGALFPVPNITIASLGQATQSTTANRVAVRLDLTIAPSITTPLNDSAVALQLHTGVNAELLREDLSLGGGVNVGQIAPRVAFHSNVFFLSTSRRGTGITPTNDAALLQKIPSGALTTLATEGGTLPGASSLKYAAFIGEGGSSANPCIRSLITSDVVTPATNEAIVFNNGSGLSMIAQKGVSNRARFLRMWPMGDRLLVHMIITGPGITSANNEVLDLYQENNLYSRLLQKGKPLPGTNGLPIAAIQRVEVSNTSGHYAVLASLRGAPASSNQILLRGDLNGGLASDRDEISLRRPTIVLRKGQNHIYGFLGSPKITSIAFAHANTMDVTGVGRKGLASVISNTGSILLRATFSDRSSRLIRLE